MAEIKDSYENLERMLEYGVKENIHALQSHSWRGRNIIVFLNGDYDFLCKVYGLSGPQGTFPCLFCLDHRKEMHYLKQEQSKLRSLASLKEDHSLFKEKYHSDKKDAAQCHNCWHKRLLEIDLDHVSPPYLHILLGVVLKHHRHLESWVDRIDRRIVLEKDENLTESGVTVKTYGKNWKQFLDTTEKLQFQKTKYVLSPEEKFKHEIEQTEKMLSEIKHEQLTSRSGPVCLHLDSVLKDHRITPQAYHSRSFVGNHCHKYLQKEVYEDISSSIVQKTKEYTNSPHIIDEAERIQIMFNDLNAAISRVHALISHSHEIEDTRILDIDIAIKEYIALYRRLFPKKVIPKQHLLENHCLPWIKKFRVGLGLLGEQETESSHQSIARLRKRACGIVDELKQLHFVMNNHLLQVAPQLHRTPPASPKKARKRKI